MKVFFINIFHQHQYSWFGGGNMNVGEKMSPTGILDRNTSDIFAVLFKLQSKIKYFIILKVYHMLHSIQNKNSQHEKITKKYDQDFDEDASTVFSKYCCIFSLQMVSRSPFLHHHLIAYYKDATISSFSCNHFDYDFFCAIVSYHVINLRLLIGQRYFEVVERS